MCTKKNNQNSTKQFIIIWVNEWKGRTYVQRRKGERQKRMWLVSLMCCNCLRKCCTRNKAVSSLTQLHSALSWIQLFIIRNFVTVLFFYRLVAFFFVLLWHSTSTNSLLSYWYICLISHHALFLFLLSTLPEYLLSFTLSLSHHCVCAQNMTFTIVTKGARHGTVPKSCFFTHQLLWYLLEESTEALQQVNIYFLSAIRECDMSCHVMTVSSGCLLKFIIAHFSLCRCGVRVTSCHWKKKLFAKCRIVGFTCLHAPLVLLFHKKHLHWSQN